MNLTAEDLKSLQGLFYQYREFPAVILNKRGFVGMFSGAENTVRGPKIVLAIEVRYWKTPINGGVCFKVRRDMDSADGRPLVFDFSTGKIILPSEIQAVAEPGVNLIKKPGGAGRAAFTSFVSNDSTQRIVL